jgi:hypothetical protein
MVNGIFCKICNKEMELGSLLTEHLILAHPKLFLEIFYEHYIPSKTGIIDQYFEVREID